MGLLTQIATLPLAPVRGVAWVIERVVETGEKTPRGWRKFNLATDFQRSRRPASCPPANQFWAVCRSRRPCDHTTAGTTGSAPRAVPPSPGPVPSPPDPVPGPMPSPPDPVPPPPHPPTEPKPVGGMRDGT